jgi:hypothetical protein
VRPFLATLFAIIGVANVVAYVALTRFHPRRRPIVIALLVIGNLLWPFFPILAARTHASRLIRSLLGPPWFAWSCFALLYAMFALIVFVAWLPFRRRTTFERFGRRPSRVLLWTVLISLPVGVYQCLVPLRVERVPVTIAGLPPALEGRRIVLLGDLHTGLFSRPSRLRRIFATARELRPDLVIVAGDLIDDDPYYIPKLLDGTRALDPATPLLAVLGNHEMYGSPREVVARLRGSRIRLLVNEGAAVRGLWIAGVSDYAAQLPDLRPNLDRALAGKPPSAFPMVVAHQPEDLRRGTSEGTSSRALRAHTRRPVRLPPAPLVARRPLRALPHGPLPARSVAALREHRHRLLAPAVAAGDDAGDHADRAAAVMLAAVGH